MELRTWLSEFKSLSDSDIKSYSQKYIDEDFVREVYEMIHSDLAKSTRSIVVTLKSFITSGEPSLINFVGLLIPLLIAFYLKPENSDSKADLESLFVFYMNQDAEQFKIMKLPALQQNTIYHDSNDFDHFNDKLSDHHLQYANKTDSFITITAENRSNAIAALLERVYHIEMMNLYMHVAKDLFTIVKSPIPNEDCITALARIGGLYHKESAKLLHACHDIAQEHIYMRALFVTNALLNLCPSISGHKTSERSEKMGMRRAVTSKSIRHHQWTSSSENLDGESSQAVTRSLTTEENLTAIIEVDDEITRRKTSTQVVSPGSRKSANASTSESEPLLSS